ncbi:neurofilament heavy polypeptide-like [Eurosta solidaginis]|uniref:neurofilament heavy polypeptide-like n=1 Tax=Eurosta solidaginis TaxID=178769 RepID=UPI003530DF82
MSKNEIIAAKVSPAKAADNLKKSIANATKKPKKKVPIAGDAKALAAKVNPPKAADNLKKRIADGTKKPKKKVTVAGDVAALPAKVNPPKAADNLKKSIAKATKKLKKKVPVAGDAKALAAKVNPPKAAGNLKKRIADGTKNPKKKVPVAGDAVALAKTKANVSMGRKKNDGKVKRQESWMAIIRKILASSNYELSDAAGTAFERLQSFENVPRKKEKFQNFVKHCLHLNMSLSVELWSILEKEQEKMKIAFQKDNASVKSKETENPKKNALKRKANEGHDDPPTKKSKNEKKVAKVTPLKVADNSRKIITKNPKKKTPAAVGSTETTVKNKGTGKKTRNNKEAKDRKIFPWSAILKQIVGKNAEGIALEKLKELVLKRYTAKPGAKKITEKGQKMLEKKFAKMLKKSVGLQVEGDIVKPSSLVAVP